MKLNKNIITLTIFLLWATISNAQKDFQWKTAKSGDYTYKYVTNDPTKSRIYTLKNGLTVILAQNNKEPRVSFKMAVRAGSNHDPRNNTGLAHYLEHLLFKGTDKFGTMGYAKEKPLLDKIVALYETYNKTTNPDKRKDIYQQIDMLSSEASNFAIANEYDKMMKSIGSRTTNAHTSVEETIYHEDLPSNSIDKFLALQAERFRFPVFRLFHTELEAVYEEKNRGLDNDGNKMSEGLLKALFPTHNYGQQSTIGTIEHLKNPSLVEIRNYYNKYYVPNNMALIMAGDINYDELIKKIDKNFSYMVSKEFGMYTPAPEKPMAKVQEVNVYGPSAESLYIAYRGFAHNTRQSLMLNLISRILSNGKAGLLDININKQQKMLRAGAGYDQMKDYGIFIVTGSPKSGQSLTDIRDLLLAQIGLLKQGSFDESLIQATVANIKMSELQAYDSNVARASLAAEAFILNKATTLDKILGEADEMAKLSKKEIVDFASQFFVENYVVVFKNKGEDKNIQKVDKPSITAIKTNTNEVSNFTKTIISGPVAAISPKFLDYKKDLKLGKAKIADVVMVQNTENQIFRLSYRFDMGSFNYKLLPYAAQYLTFLGTDKYTAEDVSKAFYKIACSYNVNVGNDMTTISISGLQENFGKAIAMVEHVLAHCKPNEKALNDLKQSVLKIRENNKLNKSAILSGLNSYAQYGPKNPFNYGLTNEEIKNIKSSDLIDLLQNLTNYKHTITYYGPNSLPEFTSEIIKAHPMPSEFTPAAPMKKFEYVATDNTKVLFADYDMVQAEIFWTRNTGLYNPLDAAKINLFNSYFGGGMGSVVFQTIRESKALAYSTYAMYQVPNSRDKQTTVSAYVGAQADKTKDAIAGMNELLNILPEYEKSFVSSKTSAMNSMETSRINNDGIIASYLSDKKMGFDRDSRIDNYNSLKKLSFADIKNFHKQHLSGKPYIYSIVASEKKINLGDLEKIGPVEKLTLEEVFGY